MPDLTIRKATINDVPLIAWVVMEALDLDSNDLERAKASCATDNSLYSWRHALVAEVDGTPVGCLISYDGGKYLGIREGTWRSIWPDVVVDEDTARTMAIETYPGEYYLDSMALMPGYRGLEIGKRLMEAAIEQARAEGFEEATLIVSVDKPRLQSYYSTLGFRPVEEISFFGHPYIRMRKVLT